MTKGAGPARTSATLAAAATTALLLLAGACTSGAPTAATGATARTTTTAADGGGRLFPLVRDAPSDGGTTARRVGFVNQAGRLVVRPTYRAYQTCPTSPGADVILAWGDGQLDVLDAAGQTIGALAGAGTDPEDPTGTDVRTVVCGPVAGYATVGTTQGLKVVTLPGLAPSDLPGGVALDASVIWVPATEQGGRRTAAPYLYDTTTSTKTTLPDDAAGPVPAEQAPPAATGGWPVPVLDAKGSQRYLAKTGSWASTQVFTQAGRFVDGHAWVSTGPAAWYFVDTALVKTGRDYASIVPLLTTDGAVTGYQVTSAAGQGPGLVTVDLKVVVDPDTESAVCAESPTGGQTCVASAADGTARLVVLPEGTSTPLPQGMTTALSDRLVTDAARSAVHNLTTGQTFDVPPPFRATAGWADAYVEVAADNGLRMMLDGTGAATALGTITGQVVADDGTSYFWATTRGRQGYVDAAGDWLYHEARYTVLED